MAVFQRLLAVYLAIWGGLWTESGCIRTLPRVHIRNIHRSILFIL